MYSKERGFTEPENPNQKTWRFIDFTKYVDLLEKQSLYFCRLDKFKDPYEGVFPTGDKKSFPLHQWTNLSRQLYFVNCWHMNDYESAGMWDLYNSSENGIAIQSTFPRMKQSFDNTDKMILMSTVKYHDYESKTHDELLSENKSTSWIGSSINPATFKRSNFEHEKEIRALYVDLPVEVEQKKIHARNLPSGMSIKVHLDSLIERIVVSPRAESWFVDLVKAVSMRYGLKCNVDGSNLYRRTF
ncbi:MAG: DUF2971 domain-containing protein [Proteobacteria bacterium]|nr:MAG: DUF2971 domain-containing protein [Pseudomonadota bacterium]